MISLDLLKQISCKKVYYSSLLEGLVEHFFTSRDLVVKENIDLICKYLKIDKKNLIHPIQTHSSNVEIVQYGKSDYPDCDSLILDKKDIAIYLNFADCIPVILYDAENNVAAVVHCGWRGTASKLAVKTILKMQQLYNTKPNDIIAVIGPGISFKHFETSKEIICLLKETIENPDGLFDENHADLKGINKRQLNEIGVEKIDIFPYCTVDDNDKFFSYRKENKTTLRHSAVVKLNF